VVSMSRELTAPIARLNRQDAAAPAVADNAEGCAAGKGVRLRATGYMIDLVTSREKAETSGKCPNLAGGEDNDARFERLWARSGGRG
ncbi:MAG TPA: hypothetical protein VF442_13555, partial [Sphingobium sp.]